MVKTFILPVHSIGYLLAYLTNMFLLSKIMDGKSLNHIKQIIKEKLLLLILRKKYLKHLCRKLSMIDL
nr:MAG TPA: hypothetical protein [Caudoviricetes sp.]